MQALGQTHQVADFCSDQVKIGALKKGCKITKYFN